MENQNIITVKKPKSPISEAYRTLRTNIQFSSFDNEVQIIAITSSGPGEGKSTTAANLAVVMAESGAKTILIDCDQRKPTLHRIFSLSNQAGISDLLVGNVEFQEAVKSIEIQNLDVLTSGTTPPNPAELLASSKMKQFVEGLRQNYEYIIIDTPPIIAVTDAQLLSSYADGCILVVSSSQVERKAAEKAKELLQKVNAKILGAVLNKLKMSEKRYYYSYYYGNDDHKFRKKKEKRKSST